MNIKHALSALALVVALSPSAALAYCNGVGSSCSYSPSTSHSYTQSNTYGQRQGSYGYQQPYYGSYGYGYQQPQSIYFPIYNTTFPNYGSQSSYGSYGSYGYQQMYGYGYSYNQQPSWNTYHYGY